MRSVIDWLNENEQRAYPLCTDPGELTHTVNNQQWTIPDSFLLDLKLITAKKLAGLDVHMTEIVYTTDDTIEVAFGAAGDEIARFTIANPASLSYPLYIRNPDGNLAVFGEGVDQFYQLCDSPVELSLALTVEPTACVEYGSRWLGVTSLGAVPEKETIEIPPGDDWSFPYAPMLPLSNVSTYTRLTGDVTLLDGYNFSVATGSGAVALNIALGEGLRMDCTTGFLQPEYLDCGQLVSYINGSAPDPDDRTFTLTPSADIVITAGNLLDSFVDNFSELSNQHTLFFGLAQKATDLCRPIYLF
jgi:hypothetical protein